MASSTRTSLILAAAIAAALNAQPAHAEEGDYAWWQTLINLVSPPARTILDRRTAPTSSSRTRTSNPASTRRT